MKRTEQRWMRTDDGHMTERDFIPTPTFARDYELVTVTWDEPEWEDVKVNADPQSPNSVWYTDERGVTCLVPKDAEIIAVFRRRKPEPEVWEGRIIQIDYADCTTTLDVICDVKPGKRVEVRVLP